MTGSIPSSSLPAGVAGTTAANGVARPHHGHGGFAKTLSAVADQLKMSTDDLRQQLAGGRSLSDIAQAQGVSKDALVQTIAGTLPGTAPDGRAVDTTAMATRIADATRQGSPMRTGGNGPGSDLGTGIESLASALGVSSGDLVQRLTDGTGIADLLSANPDVSAQLAALQSKGALVDGYA
jgi:uncharacterized protein YidB (DUF937 family)